ncbi:hypothetical protein Y032_0010g1191 [Ancylostoma ceylanicum]|uniref:Uncharacterized protein n=1 Tax=Ancylostoma ceylanicum TaxID=53326 RepID=A0A016VIC5_9BILA|nr:hypothetical protein Y032_0010g1191 [Ancylostoma ceylanicum]
MRLPDLLSAVTLNVVLALFSMVMAIVALGLLAFVLAKDTYLQKDTLPTVRDKIKRHESVVVDFRNPSTVPDHFLQLNTLMFQKKPRNNLITEMPAVPLSGMHMMSSTNGNQNVDGELTAIPAEAEDVVSNKVSSVLRAQRSASEEHQATTPSPSSFVTDSGISDDDYSSDTTENHEDRSKTSTENPSREGSGWIEEKSTIEPLAEKIIVDLECGSEFSLC